MTDHHSFSLWHTPWITTQNEAGKIEELSVRDCLVRSHEIVEIREAHSVYTFGVYRLLIAILQSLYGLQGVKRVQDILSSGHFPEKDINSFGDKFSNRFDIFSANLPFMQDRQILPDLNMESRVTAAVSIFGETLEISSVARLFIEMPSGINTTHFERRYESEQAVCPKCLTHGLLSIPSFTTICGAGFSNSFNDAPPLYVLPAGDSLFETLAYSIITSEKYLFEKKAFNDQPIWESDNIVSNKTLDAIGYIQSLLFPARRIRFFPEPTGRSCTRCGKTSDVLVSKMYFASGNKYSTSKHPRKWLDPFVPYLEDATLPAGEENRRPVRYKSARGTWKDSAYMLLGSTVELDRKGKPSKDSMFRIIRPSVVDNMIEILGDTRSSKHFYFRLVGLETNQAKIIQWVESGFGARLSDFANPLHYNTILRYLSTASKMADAVAAGLYTAYALGEVKKIELLEQLKKRGSTFYWNRTEPVFHQFLYSLSTIKDDSLDQFVLDSLFELRRIAQESFRLVADSHPAVHKSPRVIVEAEKKLNIKLAVALNNGRKEDHE